jgi:hypothetical protein
MLSGAFSTTIFQRSSIEGLESTSGNLFGQDTLRRLLREAAAYKKRAAGYIAKVRLGLQVHRFPDNKEFSPHTSSAAKVHPQGAAALR